MSHVPEEVIRRFAYKNGYENFRAEELFDELEAFLDSAASSSASPTGPVDEAWHEFILHTRLYAEYCQKRYGHFVHHVPLSPLASEGDPKGTGQGTKKCCGTGHDEGLNIEMSDHKCSSDCRGGCRRSYPGEEAVI